MKQGFDHMETLASLHFHKPAEENFEAMLLVLESLGMDEDARQQLNDCLIDFVPTKMWLARGWVMMGFMAGMLAAQNALEAD